MEYTIICPEETLFGVSIKPQDASPLHNCALVYALL